MNCPHCGAFGVARKIVAFNNGEHVLLREIDDHECPGWAPKPPLDQAPSDTSFIAEALNSAESLARWRKAERSGPPDNCDCRICTEEREWQSSR